MRLSALLFTAILVASPVAAQPIPASSAQDRAKGQSATDPGSAPAFSVTRIREALETTPTLSFGTLDERPIFRVQIQERQHIEELLATLDFKAGPVPAGGLYMAEQDRIMFPSVDNPLRQPLSAFSQPELLTILIENLAGRYLGGKAASAISKAERVHAEAVAKEEVRSAVGQYCDAQPNGGAGIQICEALIR
jgi:hypothetical protein